MVEKKAEWILPENLRNQEVRERAEVEDGTFSGEGDFGSYCAYLKGIDRDLIEPHAIADDRIALEYVRNISQLLRTFHLKLEGNIIDIGCAIGTTANGISQFNKCGNTYGLDISEDAIEVATKRYPDCTFYCQSADNLDNFDDGYFDVIHAREFYPFTRTNDIDYHMKYLSLFHQKLKPHGYVVLQMIDLDEGFCNTYDGISRKLNDTGYSTVRRKALVTDRIFRKAGNMTYNTLFYPILLFATRTLLRVIRGRGVGYLYICIKERGSPG